MNPIPQTVLQLTIAATLDLGLGEIDQNKLATWMNKVYELGKKEERNSK